MREELPTALTTGGGNIREVIANGDVERDAAPHAIAVHGRHHAPDTDAISVVAPGVVEHVGHRSLPRGSRRVQRRIELIVPAISRAPACQARAPGPDDLRSVG